MSELGAVLEQLKQERKRAEGELQQLEAVIATLSKMTGNASRSSRFRQTCETPPVSCRQRTHRRGAKGALGEGTGEEVILKMSNSV